ncbi:hypothetical protein HUG10_04615 [Halorarum halophilum]|uniref:Uncharacterized protein n=1 Tax=Halorarum halophilum TaxID=2743090 RepID=A0A7D5GJY1_9EURY|nr:hypothetical protein [Halobaculum halophilum]QLG26867.1 hypothetical protein HUG10_04615 [Halobaculum halophilum]
MMYSNNAAEEIRTDEEHFATHTASMLEGDVNEYHWTFAPFTRNTTFLDVNDHDYQAWQRGLPSSRRREVEKRDHRFQRYNAGTHNLAWHDNTWLRRCDDWYWCHAISDTLEMTEHQKRRVCRLYDQHIDMRAFPSEKYGEQSKWLVVPFCICVLVHNENQQTKENGDRDERYVYYPGKKDFPSRQAYDGSIRRAYDATNDRHILFMEFLEELPLDTPTVISCLERVRDRVPDFKPMYEPDFVRNEAVNQVLHAEV